MKTGDRLRVTFLRKGTAVIAVIDEFPERLRGKRELGACDGYAVSSAHCPHMDSGELWLPGTIKTKDENMAVRCFDSVLEAGRAIAAWTRIIDHINRKSATGDRLLTIPAFDAVVRAGYGD